jgi:hypothetical protein
MLTSRERVSGEGADQVIADLQTVRVPASTTGRRQPGTVNASGAQPLKWWPPAIFRQACRVDTTIAPSTRCTTCLTSRVAPTPGI